MKNSNITKKSSGNLTEALYKVYDLGERTGIPFVLLNDTARQVYESKPLEREIYAGAKISEFTPQRIRDLKEILKRDHAEPVIGDKEIKFEYMGAKVHLIFIKNKLEFFKDTNLKFYNVFEFNLPNPFEEYWKVKEQV